ncbi:MAG: hypothetical protein ACOCXA_05765 [Planctomycetota bacterium]
MVAVASCPVCTSTKIASGRLQSTGNVHFVPDDTRFLSAHTSNVAVQAHLCVDCGQVLLTGDNVKAEKIVKS